MTLPVPDHHHYALLQVLGRELDESSGGNPMTTEEFCAREGIDFFSMFYATAERSRPPTVPNAADRDAWVRLYALTTTASTDGFALGYLFALTRTDR